jgi:hypothetical protein
LQSTEAARRAAENGFHPVGDGEELASLLCPGPERLLLDRAIVGFAGHSMPR